MDIVLLLHNLVRYLVLIAAIIGLIKVIVSLILNSADDKIDGILGSAFLGLFDLQAFLGVLIIFLGGLAGPLHPLIMFVALVIAHVLSMSVRKSSSDTVKRMRFFLYFVPTSIIVMGLAIIGQLRM